MFYLIPAATLAMLGYVFWRATFRMRRDRLEITREQTRGKFAFRSRERLRFLLVRSFAVAQDRPPWEDELVSTLGKMPVSRSDGCAHGSVNEVGDRVQP
jgi:hypothetical protein